MDLIYTFFSDFGAVIGVIVGGVCTIYGSYLSASKQVKSQNRIFDNEVLNRTQQLRWELKYSLLADFMGNRGSLVVDRTFDKDVADPIIFFNALNQLEVVFYDSEKVLDKYRAFRATIFSEQGMNTDALYHLSVAMHEDLNIKPPDKSSFLNPLVINMHK